MPTYWSDLERTVAAMEDFRRLFGRTLGGGDHRHVSQAAGWPSVNMYDAGSTLKVTAEVPGLTEKDLAITVNQNVLTLSGERKADAPEGYSIHRQERAPYRFSRSFSLPVRVNGEKTSATLKNGILTITLEKAPEAQPRQIAVKAS